LQQRWTTPRTTLKVEIFHLRWGQSNWKESETTGAESDRQPYVHSVAKATTSARSWTEDCNISKVLDADTNLLTIPNINTRSSA
jgi:hypothetical protein